MICRENLFYKEIMEKKAARSCHSCLMPFGRDPGKKESDIYCSLCFKDGGFLYKGDDLPHFKKICYQGMIDRGINRHLAGFYAFLAGFAPRWRKRGKNRRL